MSIIGRNRIVVGVDGTSADDAALDWAIEEAGRRHLPLHLVHAREREVLVTDSTGYAPAVAGLMAELAEEGTARLAANAARARLAAPGLTVTTQLSTDFAAQALVELSDTADTIVLGSLGWSGLAHALLGSVSHQVAQHAQCPVVVVRGHRASTPAPRGVVVGVDGSAAAELALGYAFEEASSRGCPLDVVHVWWTRATGGLTGEYLIDQQTQQGLALAETLAGWSEKYPDVEVHRHLPKGSVVPALLEQAQSAELLVVGSRGRGGFRSLLLGSVSHEVLQHAACPVAVVRPHLSPAA